MNRAIAAFVAALVLVIGVKTWNSHLLSQGDARGAARVLAEWDATNAENAAIAERQRADREKAARAEEATKQKQAERTAREQAQRESTLQANVARTGAFNRSLLGTIAEINARNDELSRTAEDAHVAAIAREATAARQLLGSCSGRYSAVAADADGYRNQVIGLQDFVANVCHATVTGGEQ